MMDLAIELRARRIEVVRLGLFCGLTFAFGAGGDLQSADLFAELPATGQRVWIGPAFWANRLQDWQLSSGRIECVEGRQAKPMRTVHVLTHRVGDQSGSLRLEVVTGEVEASNARAGTAAAGFLIGAGGNSLDYRAAALVHHSPGPGAGVFCGVDRAGRTFIRDHSAPSPPPDRTAARALASVRLVLDLEPAGDAYRVTLRGLDSASGEPLSETTATIEAARAVGGIALVSHPGEERARFWFRGLEVSGTKLDIDASRTAGPVLSTQYTLSRGILKLTAQLMPIGLAQDRSVTLEVNAGDGWKNIATAEVIAPGWTATFRLPGWDDSRDLPYRVTHEGRSWGGTIRRDPVDKRTIVVAGFTGNHNCRRGVDRRGPYYWLRGLWFPHDDLVANLVRHEPDVLFFSGDQVYEGASPTGVDRANVYLDYLYKWYLWCWAFRDLSRDIPTVTIPDDHDVYQGNLWGEGGRKTDKDDKGGYVWPAPFVRMVERTQTANLPDPYDPTPIAQEIGVYYTGMTYGRISFAVLEDRKFKSGCSGRVPPSGSRRADHIVDEEFDVMKADVPGVQLLGRRQLDFLADWAADWRGADMKVALSQTVFGGMATHHGGNLQYLRADLDSNGWPQSGRRRALEELRRGFAFHLAGDQHLATIVHHGIDDWEDAGWSFAVPSIANFYPRKWEPKTAGENREPGAPEYTGRHRDGLMNRVTVFGASNPGRSTGREPKDLHDSMPGYGILRLDKETRTIRVECWPRYAVPGRDAQYEGWPRVVTQQSNYGRAARAYLPRLEISGMEDPVVQVIAEATGEVVYTIRIRGREFHPWVFAPGRYRVAVGEPGTRRWKSLPDLEAASRESAGELRVDL